VFYSEDIEKKVRKNQLSKRIFIQFDNAFKALDLTNDLSLFDIKRLKESNPTERIYFRLRKGKYRTIFYIHKKDFFIIAIDKREEVYKKWA